MIERPDEWIAKMLEGLMNGSDPWFRGDVFPTVSHDPVLESHPQAVYAESGRIYEQSYQGLSLSEVEFLVTITALDSQQCRLAGEAFEQAAMAGDRVAALSGTGESVDDDSEPLEYSRQWLVTVGA